RALERAMRTIVIKRVYAPPSAEDGARVLVDRIWPRGLTKDAARLDAWIKGVAPSTKLRQWFGHDPARWLEFQRRYRSELKANADALAEVRKLRTGRGRLTLLFAAHDEDHNNAVVLAAVLRSSKPARTSKTKR